MPSRVTDRPVPAVAQELLQPDVKRPAPCREDMNRSNNNQQLQDSTPTEVYRSSYEPVVTYRERPSLPSEEHLSYYQNVTPPKKPDEAGNDENHQPKFDHIITPLIFRPVLKAGPRSNKRKGRKLGKSMIATDTPEKARIAEERTAALNKRKVLQDCGNQMFPSTKKK